jgi:hypothetical protein
VRVNARRGKLPEQDNVQPRHNVQPSAGAKAAVGVPQTRRRRLHLAQRVVQIASNLDCKPWAALLEEANEAVVKLAWPQSAGHSDDIACSLERPDHIGIQLVERTLLVCNA